MLADEKSNFVILHGSVTGQAETIAEKIYQEALDKKLGASLHCLSKNCSSFDISKINLAIFVVSTTGDGDIPDTAGKFWRWMKRKSISSDFLKHFQFALLGLGDTNYNNFCNSGKKIETRLCELGAQKFYPSGYADDAVGLECVVEPWIEGLWAPLIKILNVKCEGQTINIMESSKPNINSPVCQLELNELKKNSKEISCLTTLNESLSETALNVPAFPKPYLAYDVQNLEQSHVSLDLYENKLKRPSSASSVFFANCISARYLSKPDSKKTVIEITFDISGGHVKYVPGDAFGFFAKNNYSEVCALLSRISMLHNKDKMLKIYSSSERKSVSTHLPEDLTLEQIFLHCIEIRSIPKKSFLRALAEYTVHEQEKSRLLQLCSRQGAEDYRKFIRSPNVCLMDLLMAFSSCQPPLEVVLEHLPCMLPRFYSVSSSPLFDANIMKIAFSVVEIPKCESRHSDRLGVCTGFFEDNVGKFLQHTDSSTIVSKLKNLSLDEWKIPVYLRTNMGFILPDDIHSPLIMIGPGTGVAPFISFLGHRSIQKNNLEVLGDYMLFFGCRKKENDFIYESEMINFEKESVLKNLYLSFSRDSGDTKYVQDNIKLIKEDFVKYLDNPNIKVYVCGDANNMAKSVFDCIVSIVKVVKDISLKEAENFVKILQVDKKYLQDIWC
ncbi:Methionine synthase reductase [Nymphon striatum]|nr:Methionine synthase reductase [Nymphon striatum]